jgi:hypothetical protein
VAWNQLIAKDQYLLGRLDGQAGPASIGLDDRNPDADLLQLIQKVVDRGTWFQRQPYPFTGSPAQYQPAHMRSLLGSSVEFDSSALRDGI